MLLDNKTAIVYGAAGAIGSAVAQAYAREGAEVHLVGRTAPTMEEVAQRIQRDGGNPHVMQLDVLDRPALERHAATVAAASGGIDVCFNATSNDDRQGTPLLDMQFEDFLRPVTKAAHVAWTALAGLCRQLAAEFGPHGVRVSWLLSPGSPGYKASDQQPQHPSDDDSEPGPAPGTQGLLLHHQPTYDEVANTATFAASDWARTIIASEINITGGAVID